MLKKICFLLFPLAALLLGIDVFLAPPTVPQPMDWQIKLHVSVALVAFAAATDDTPPDGSTAVPSTENPNRGQP